MSAVATRMTAEEFLSAPENETCELIDGVPRRMDMGIHSALIGGEILFELRSLLRREPTGVAVPADGGFALWRGRSHVRKPDVSYVSFERIGSRSVPSGWFTVPPNLAIEVISPNDKWHEVEEKVSELLAAGVDLVWVVDPQARFTNVYGHDGSFQRVPADQPLDAGTALPGFRLVLAEILERVPPAE